MATLTKGGSRETPTVKVETTRPSGTPSISAPTTTTPCGNWANAVLSASGSKGAAAASGFVNVAPDKLMETLPSFLAVAPGGIRVAAASRSQISRPLGMDPFTVRAAGAAEQSPCHITRYFLGLTGSSPGGLR